MKKLLRTLGLSFALSAVVFGETPQKVQNPKALVQVKTEAAFPLASNTLQKIDMTTSKQIERTLVIFKPDCIIANNQGKVLDRLLNKGLSIVECKMMQLTKPLLDEHYDFLTAKPFYPEIVKFMSSTKVMVLIVEGENAIKEVRNLLGPTDSKVAPKGTLRGDFGTDNMRNVAHASDSAESASKEIKRFFPELYKA